RELEHLPARAQGHDRIRHHLHRDRPAAGNGRHSRVRTAAARRQRDREDERYRICTTPHAIRPPALPVGCVFRSSGFAWRITAWPTTDVVPGATVIPCSVRVSVTLPLASASTLPKSPA